MQMQGEREGDISVLPEGCISSILSFTSPRDVGKSSLVSSMFKYAADSDIVWDQFLPSDYMEIISRSSSVSSLNLNDFSSKKQLYLHLCDNPFLIDGGKMSFNIEKKNGKKCFMIGAKELKISWGDGKTPWYWKWESRSDSRFAEVAELRFVCWLEIRGIIETPMLSRKTLYVAYLVIKFADNTYGLDHEVCQVSVRFVRGVGDASGSRDVLLIDPNKSPSVRSDGWMEIELGELFNDQGEDGEVEMSLTQINCHISKSGLIVQGLELRPKV